VTDCNPFTDLEPNQLPDAVQLVAFVDDQVSVADWPTVIVVGFAEIVTVGTGAITGGVGAFEATVKVVVATVDFPQVNVYTC
jgi:hypothetical protein